MQPVQQLALAEHGRLGGVEVLRLAGPEQATAEAHDARRRILDREDQPVPKARSRLAGPVGRMQQAGLDQPLVVEAERVQVRAHQPQLARGEAEPHPVGQLATHLALLEISPCRLAQVVLPERAPAVFRRRAIHFPERLAGILLVRMTGVHLDDIDARFFPDHPDRGHEVHADPLHEVGEDVAALVAHEAVVSPDLRGDGEIASGALMERTRSAKIRPGALELHVLADHPDDVGALTNALHRLVGYHANTATVTPAPPSFQPAMWNSFTRVSLRSISSTTWRSAPVPLP